MTTLTNKQLYLVAAAFALYAIYRYDDWAKAMSTLGGLRSEAPAKQYFGGYEDSPVIERADFNSTQPDWRKDPNITWM